MKNPFDCVKKRVMPRNTSAVSKVTAIIIIASLGVVLTAAVLVLTPPVAPATFTSSATSDTAIRTIYSTTEIQPYSVATQPSPGEISESNLSAVISSFRDYLGNFSQMSVQTIFNGSNQTASFEVLSRPQPNTTGDFLVNFTLSSSIPGAGYHNSSALLRFDNERILVSVTFGNSNYTGLAAIAESSNFTAPFDTMLSFTNAFFGNQTVVSSLEYTGRNTVSYGNTAMTVETYDLFSRMTINTNVTLFSALLMLGTVHVTGEKAASALITYYALKTSIGLYFGSLLSVTPA